MLDGAELSDGASVVAAGRGTTTAQAMARKRGSSGAAAAGGSAAALLCFRVPGVKEEREREERERERSQRVDFKFSQKISHELKNLQKQKLFKI